jgi:hypothetical protein
MTTDVSTRPSGTARALIEGLVDIETERRRVDVWALCRQSGDVGFRHVLAPFAPEQAQLGDWIAVTGHHEARAGFHSGHYLCVLITQLALRDDAAHVGKCSKARYASLQVRMSLATAAPLAQFDIGT